MSLKYIMFAFTFGGTQRLYALTFPDDLVHSLVAEAHRHYRHGGATNWVRPVPVSAGFMAENSSGQLECYGESESLKLRAHPEDARIIDTHSYLHGIGFAERDENPPRIGKGGGE